MCLNKSDNPDNHKSMTPPLLKNEIFDLFQHFKTPQDNFSVAVDWHSINTFGRNFLGFKTKIITDRIDLGLTCVMFDRQNQMTDLVCSSKFNSWLIKNSFPLGKNTSKDKAFRHFDYESKADSHYKQVLYIELQKISNEVDHIYFYLCFDLRKIKSPDFSNVNSLKLTALSGAAQNKIISEQDIRTEKSCKENEGVMILAKLYRENEKWKFTTIGKAITESTFIRFTKGIQ